MRCVFTERAESDLEDIADYISQDSSKQALQFIAKLRERCLAIAVAPEAYPLCPSYGAGIRKVVVGRYLLFYRAHDDEVVILHITQGARSSDDISF
jgi:toxin ParE1/3/4